MAILGLSTRATNALDRVGVTTVRQLLDLPVGDVRFMRGVGKKTRDEIIAVARPPPAAVPDEPARTAGRRSGPGDEPRTRRRSTSTPCAAGCSARRRGSKADKAVQDPRAVPGPAKVPGDWPTQAEVSAAAGT